MVQGPQIRIVNELLLSKGVPKRYIDTFDKTAKKGKGKK
jgi:translation initiation factor 2D